MHRSRLPLLLATPALAWAGSAPTIPALPPSAAFWQPVNTDQAWENYQQLLARQTALGSLVNYDLANLYDAVGNSMPNNQAVQAQVALTQADPNPKAVTALYQFLLKNVTPKTTGLPTLVANYTSYINDNQQSALNQQLLKNNFWTIGRNIVKNAELNGLSAQSLDSDADNFIRANVKSFTIMDAGSNMGAVAITLNTTFTYGKKVSDPFTKMARLCS